MSKIVISPCAHCKGKDDEECPCADKTVYDIRKISDKKKRLQQLCVEGYVRKRTNNNRARRMKKYYGR